MFRLLVLASVCLCSSFSFATHLSDAECESALTLAEETPDPSIYTTCGFNDELKAWNTWAPFAAAHDMKRALYELCVRYPRHQYGPLYCQKAVDLNYGPALAYIGDQELSKRHEKEAIDYYAKAIQAGDLSDTQVAQIREKTGFLYLKEGTSYFNSRAGIALLVKAANSGSAVANNALGYLIYSGKYNLRKDPQKSLEYIWKAILYGCPAAEENLGAFHLARQGKITEENAEYYMSLQSYTCKPFPKDSFSAPNRPECNCKEIKEKESQYQAASYFYLEMQEENQALLSDKDGNTMTYTIGNLLPDGSSLREIRPGMIATLKDGKREVILRYHTGDCVDYCLTEPKESPVKQPVNIRPYHLTFTKQECSDINFYANKLIDIKKDFVGKKECLPPELDETSKLLLGM